MTKCLFTDEELDTTTRLEHVLPRSLGGRIRSREVSSSTFNERCGDYLDNTLKAVYAPIMNRLGPLLSSEFKVGQVRVDVPGEAKGFILEDGGVLTRENVIVIERDEDGHPKSILGPSKQSLRKIISQIAKQKKEIVVSEVPASTATVVYQRVPVIAPEIDLAALKSALMAFDLALRGTAHGFTRSPALQGVREMVRDAVASRQINGELMNRFSLGLQYDKLDLIKQLRSKAGGGSTLAF